MPDCCIVEIRKYGKENTEFEDRIGSMESPQVVEMFHGTKFEYVNNILSEGLKSSYNRTSAYGKGTYFSPDVKFSLVNYTNKSQNDISYVFLCSVIVDDTNGNKTNIYVCPRNDSFKIDYLISFYKC